MTSVMPAWKQALLEKKRKKEQEERTKNQVQNDNSAYLPEWKKALLARKKGVQSQDVDYGLDNPNINNNSSVGDRVDKKTKYFSTTSIEREHESSYVKSLPKVIIIPKGSSQNGIKGEVKQHSFVATSSVSQSGGQKEGKQLDQKPSNNSLEYFNYQENFTKTDEANSKVSYEHIRTPSELRKLFGVQSRDYSLPFSAESNKTQNQQTQSNKDISVKPHQSTGDYEQGQTFTSDIYPHSSSREFLSKDMVSSNHDNVPRSAYTPASNEVKKENSIIISANEDNDIGLGGPSENYDRSNGVKEREIPSEVHVHAIRTKFGPSGNFRLHKSSSSDNLVKSKHQPMSSRSNDKPPPFTKRWSADIGGILSSTKYSNDDNDLLDSHDSITMKRMRSKSLGDLAMDQLYYFEPVVDLRHKASISTGIERRLQVLLHSLSVADANDDNDENKNYYVDQNFKYHFPGEFKSSSARSSAKQMDDDLPGIRKASWYNPEDDLKETSPLNLHKVYDSNEKSLSSVDPIEKSSILSSDINKSSLKQEKNYKQSKSIKPEKEAYNCEVLLNEQEVCPPVKPVNLNCKASNEPVYDDAEKDEKPPKGSVYKLSSIFGSSISKGSKKDKIKRDDDDGTVKSKTTKEQLVSQERLSNNEMKDSKKSSSSRTFPWSKKPKKLEPMEEVKGEHTYTFSGGRSLRPVHQEVVEQKVSGNVTLIINKNAGSYDSRSMQKQPLYKETFNSTDKVPGISRYSINDSNGLTGQNSQMSSLRSKNQNQNQTLHACHKPDDMMVTVIDVPGISSTDDVQVSAIDLPGPPSPISVSVIDIPESPEHDVKVSVIDIPDDEVDSDDSEDSDSSSSGMSGSYDIVPINGSGDSVPSFTSGCTEDEEEEDIDNVPVSYVGDSTYMKVPEVIFESKVEGVKSCLKSGPFHSRKRKVVFSHSNLEYVHDYPSEECMQSHYDQYLREKGGKAISQYEPSSVQSEKRQKTEEKGNKSKRPLANKQKVLESTDSPQFKNEKDAPIVTYLDQGEGFTSSSSSSALLF